MASIEVFANCEEATEQLAAQVARYAVVGDIIRLEGDLGMGKTTFARAFLRSMAQSDNLEVPSPTFTIVQPYHETRLPVAHVDAYRLTNANELTELDLQNYFSHGVTLFEWGSNVEEAIPSFEIPESFMMESEEGDLLTITLVEGDDENSRKITLEAQGSWVPRFGLVDPSTARQVTEEGRQKFLAETCNMPNMELTPASADCSFRTYYRVGDKILMDAPAPMENVAPFVKTAQIWQDLGVHVPQIHQQDVSEGYLLLEDFGKKLFTQGFNEDESSKMPWLEATVDMLANISNQFNADGKDIKKQTSLLYNASNAWMEASRYPDWYLPAQRKQATEPEQRAHFRQIWQDTYQNLPEIPLTLSHWDFHSDNLMMLGDEPANNIGVIDFQDCRIAPIAMDMACLLEDRCPIEKSLKSQLIERFLNALDTPVNLEDFMAWYNFMTLHRFFKITGLLVRLEQRDKREGATARMPQIWETISEKLQDERFSELHAFVAENSPEDLQEVA